MLVVLESRGLKTQLHGVSLEVASTDYMSENKCQAQTVEGWITGLVVVDTTISGGQQMFDSTFSKHKLNFTVVFFH